MLDNLYLDDRIEIRKEIEKLVTQIEERGLLKGDREEIWLEIKEYVEDREVEECMQEQ